MPQHSYNQYEQHAAVKRCQQQDEDVFTEVILFDHKSIKGENLTRSDL